MSSVSGATSRLCVKNLPKHVTSERLREHFAAQGTVTDAHVLVTPEGKSRRFGFVGYASDEAARKAQAYFHRTYLDTSKLVVEFARTHEQAEQEIRPWSKYSKGSSAFQRKRERETESNGDVSNSSSGKSVQQAVGDVGERASKRAKTDDAGAERMKARQAEFMDLSNAKRPFWANDDAGAAPVPESEDMQQVGQHSDGEAPADDNETFLRRHTVADLSGGEDDDDDTGNGGDKAGEDKAGEDKAGEDKAGASGDPGDGDGDEDYSDTGRLLIKSLAHTVGQDDLLRVARQFGQVTEVHIPIGRTSKKPRGFAYVQYMLPEHAHAARQALNKQIVFGRVLRVEYAAPMPEAQALAGKPVGASAFKAGKLARLKAGAGNAVTWNALFLAGDTVADAVAAKYQVKKAALLDAHETDNPAVRLALAETQTIAETKDMLAEHGVSLAALEKLAQRRNGRAVSVQRSTRVMLVKNIPYAATVDALVEAFSRYGDLGRVIVPPSRALALVEMVHEAEAKRAFRSLAYSRFLDAPLYLEWAPLGCFDDADAPPAPVLVGPRAGGAAGADTKVSQAATSKDDDGTATGDGDGDGDGDRDDDDDDDDALGPAPSLFVKNLAFATTEATLRRVVTDRLDDASQLRSVVIARKRHAKQPGVMLSQGFGFLEFATLGAAQDALKQLRDLRVDGHDLSIKYAARGGTGDAPDASGTVTAADTSVPRAVPHSKLVVRNVPFEATEAELRSLFTAYGHVKRLRMPKKPNGGHRGFGFIEFATKKEAKQAMESLRHTHLYGRHLVLEVAQDKDDLASIRQRTSKQYVDPEKEKQQRRRSHMPKAVFSAGDGES